MREIGQRGTRRRGIGIPLLLAIGLLVAACGDGLVEGSGSSASLNHAGGATDIRAPSDPSGDAKTLPVPTLPASGRPSVDGGVSAEAAVVAASESSEPGPVTIAFGGDIHFEAYLRTGLEESPLDLLDPIGDMVADADIAVANLETVVTERGTPSDKTYNFRAPPVAFDALAAAGIDVVSMANNHGLDFGVEGLEDSLDHAAAAGFPLIGIGRNAQEAYAPWSTEVNGQRIAIIAATQVLDSSLIATWTATDSQPGLASAKQVETLTAAVVEARATHDTVVVFLHWGIEEETCPADRQMDLSDRLVDAGADAVIGGHAHRLQGGGRKGDAFVHYGLGNFVFYADEGPRTDSGVLLLTIDGRSIESYEWVPARLESGVATRLTGTEATAAVESWEALRSCTDLAS